MAAAKEEAFHDVVISNDEDLRTQIFSWSDALRVASKLEKFDSGSIGKALREYEVTLSKMKFTFPDNKKLVREIVRDLVTQFEKNWSEETQRQKDMSTRARDILLRWGSFSEDYMERAELLFDRETTSTKETRRSWAMLSLLVCVISPMAAVLPFVFALENDEEDPSSNGLMVSSMWSGFITAYVEIVFVFGFCFSVVYHLFFTIFFFRRTIPVLLLHATNLAFAKIPIGVHTVSACAAMSVFVWIMAASLRSFIGSIVPFESLFVAIVGLFLTDIFFGMIKFIPVKDKRTGQTKYWALGK